MTQTSFKSRDWFRIAIAAVVIASSPTAQASLIGQTIGCSYTAGASGNLFLPTEAVVGPGIECSGPGVFFGIVTADFSEENGTSFVEIKVPNTFTTQSFAFTNLLLANGASGIVSGFELVDTDFDLTFSNPDVSLVTGFSNHSIFVSLQGLRDFERSHFAKFRIETTHAAPEPPTSAIVALGLLGAAFARRRRARGHQIEA